MKPSILIIYTGGTIGMKPDPTTGALVPFDFSGIFEEFPTLQSLNIGIEVFTMDPVIDSSNVSPRNWLDLAAIIRDNYARYDGDRKSTRLNSSHSSQSRMPSSA